MILFNIWVQFGDGCIWRFRNEERCGERAGKNDNFSSCTLYRSERERYQREELALQCTWGVLVFGVLISS